MRFSMLKYFALFLFTFPAFISASSANPDSSTSTSTSAFDQDTSISISSSLVDAQKLVAQLDQIRSKFDRMTEVYPLQKCLQLGLKQNLLLSAGYASIQQQNYTKLSMQLENLPTISIGSVSPFLGKIHTYNSDTTYQQIVPNQNEQITVVEDTTISSDSFRAKQFGPQITLTWSFFQPALWASIEAQGAVVSQEQLAFDVTARSAVLQIQQAYYQLQASKLLIDAYEKIFNLNAQQVDLVESKFAVGLVNIGSVDQAKTQFYSQASELIQYYNQYFEDSAKLAFALNQPNDLIILPDRPLSQASTWTQSLDSTMEQALAIREEIKKYLESERSAIWNARAAVLKYLPTLSFEANYYGEYQNGTYQQYPYPKVDRDSVYESTSFGLNFSWDIFDGGVSAANAMSYKAEARNAYFMAEHTKIQVREQVRTAYSKFKLSDIKLNNSILNLKAAEQSYAAQLARYKVGLSDMTSIVQSIQQLGEAIQSKTNALLDFNDSVAELYRYSAQWPDGVEIFVENKKDILEQQSG